MIETKKSNVGGIDIQCTQFAAMRSFKLLARLGRVLSAAAPHLQGVKLESSAADLGRAISAVLTEMSEDDAAKLICDMLSNSAAIVDGKLIELNSTANIDNVFSGNLAGLFGAVKFSLEVNYGDFFAAAVAAGTRAAANQPGAKP